MRNTFTFNGISSADLKLAVQKLPARPVPKQRQQTYVVPGRSGSLHVTDGAYDSVVLSIDCVVTDLSLIPAICQALQGSGKLYSDEGISGTNIKKRKGFQKMIADALAGKIDLIITKSISRFARNTVDSISTVRQLKEKGVEVFFEKDGLWTFDQSAELTITILSSIAQEESRSLSENVKWGHRSRYQNGKVTMPFKRFLGYDRGEDGQPVINGEQAELVRRIYTMFVNGMTPSSIAKQLTMESIPTPGGSRVWQGSVVTSILTNEKYKGDALLQKTFCTNYLTKRMKVNEGEIPQ